MAKRTVIYIKQASGVVIKRIEEIIDENRLANLRQSRARLQSDYDGKIQWIQDALDRIDAEVKAIETATLQEKAL